MTHHLRSLRLVNYKGFEDHTIHFKPTNVLVGANNSGKSTALGALRLLAAMLPAARRQRPTGAGQVGGRVFTGWPITTKAIEDASFSHENIRHDFRPHESRVELTLTSGARIVASWPSIDDLAEDEPLPGGTFFVFPPDGGSITTPRTTAQDLVPDIAVVPTLTPLDDRESYVADDTLRRHQTSKRSSRYFRNSLYRLTDDEWAEFRAYVYERTPEITNLGLHRAMFSEQDDFDLFYEEQQTRQEREIAWAGDGIQIWVQALYYVWKQRDAPILILDEPDVFLHPDLQRRLARAIFETGQQTVLATHSVEILAEAPPGSAVWVDRSRRRAERPKADGALGMVGRRLGSGYELGVGRALRSQVAVFVEGDDIPILAHLARRVGVNSVASSDGYATVPLGGFTRNMLAGAFAETMTALGSNVSTVVILDGDLRSDEARRLQTGTLANTVTHLHVWQRRELENYLLDPRAIAAVSGLQLQTATKLLADSIEELAEEARTALTSQRLEERRLKGSATSKHSERTVLQDAGKEFHTLWKTPAGRLALVDAKATLRSLNSKLQAAKAKTVNTHSLAKAMPRMSVAPEVQEVIREIAALIG